MSPSPSDRSPSSVGEGTPANRADEVLHRLHDGELSTADRAAVEACLDDQARHKLAALCDLGALLRTAAAAEHAPLTERFDAWPAIEKQIAAGKVVSLRDRVARHRTPIWVSTLVAAAAVVAVLVFPPGRGSGAGGTDCQIEDLVVTGADVTVMKMADGKGEAGGTTVVWLTETE